MRPVHLLLAALVPFQGQAATPLELVCTEGKVLQVNPATLVAREYQGDTIYRLHAGKLYAKAGAAAEYEYGKVIEAEPGRYIAGHKTIYFESSANGEVAARLTHVYKDEVRASVATCRRP